MKLTAEMTLEERLDRIERCQNRICRELDYLANALQHLLTVLNCPEEAERLRRNFGALHDERVTEPPPTDRDTVPP